MFGIDALKREMERAFADIAKNLKSLGLQEAALSAAVAHVERTQTSMAQTVADLDAALDSLGAAITTESSNQATNSAAILQAVKDMAAKVPAVDFTNEVTRITNATAAISASSASLTDLGNQVAAISAGNITPPPGPPPTPAPTPAPAKG